MIEPNSNTDSRRARSEVTQTALKRAAEKLIADKGMENVSIRDIVSVAGQKNESALQYHFKNITGLLNAIREERSSETQARRAELLDALLAHTPQPTLRQICILMVQPAFDLARANADFRRYIKAFGHELVLVDSSPLSAADRHGGGGPSGREIAGLLKQALPHLDADAYRRRMDAAIRLCSASMYHQARQKNAFRSDQAELFFEHLIDALVGLLSAPVSDATRKAARQLRDRS